TAGRTGAAGARRAHGRAGPGAAPRPVGAVPPARPTGHLAAGVQPRDGGSRAVRPAAADAERSPARPRDPARAARPDRCVGRRGGVPDPCGCADDGGGRPMSPHLTLATAARVLRQIRNDPRTIGILVLLPCLLIGLIAWMFDGTPVLDQFGPLLVGLFPLIVMFLVTSVATFRERQSGTLERLMTTPVGRGDFVVGYALAFGLIAMVQALVLAAFAVWVCGMQVAGDLSVVVVVAVLDAILGASLGLAASAVARSEFQAVQMMPV